MINLGDTIDNRYNVLSHIGTGGMAVVFECKDLITNDIVAVKILKEELLNEKGMVEDFKKEVRASAQMSHQNIMKVYIDGIWNNRPYLVSEFLKTQTLLDKIEYYTKFTVKEACEIICQVLDAVGYTHNHKIIHRDIKPQNIFYLPNGTVKLGDFGIAKNQKDAENHGKIMGSVHYLAPEVLTGKPFSIGSDIYACGVTFFQLVTGVLPFDGSTEEVAKSHLKKEFPKPSMFVTTIPNRIDEIILKAVSKNPKKRFKNAAEFKKEIVSFLENKEEKKSLFKRIF